MLHLKNLSKDFNGKEIFHNINWHLKKGERVGLVGENGAGKTTLMRTIAGQIEVTSGTIQLARGSVIGYLPQDGMVAPERALFAEAMTAFVYLRGVEEELQEITSKLENTCTDRHEHEEMLERFGDLQEEFRLKGGYAMEAEVGNVLRGLGFLPSDWERSCAEFSGGWQMRIALARLLLQKPQVLLLDEPTNHLDIEARNWLEEYLKEYPYSVVLVSHDRFFMDQVCGRITEVWNCNLTDYHCNYSAYLVQREERIARLVEAKRRQDEEIRKIEDFINRFRYKADKASLVQSRAKQLEKIERITLPPERKRIRFSFPPAEKSGRIVLELRDVRKAYGEKVVLDCVNLQVERGEKIAIIGQNGAGKSTLMKVLVGSDFQSGERIVGHNVFVDYFAQNQSDALRNENTVYEELLHDAPFAAVPELRNILGAFLFSGDEIDKNVGVLSGGEKNRLALAKMLLRSANVLLLDEPTNHLDLFSKEVLLDALRSFPGTVIFVSHDRHFIDALASRVLAVEGGRITSYLGNYEDYLEKSSQLSDGIKREAVPELSAGCPRQLAAVTSSKNERLQRREEEKQKQKEQRARLKKLTEIETLIEEHEDLLEKLERRMSDPDFFRDADAAKKGKEDHDDLTGKIKGLYEEWEVLQQKIGM